jgi:hypothetical protein
MQLIHKNNNKLQEADKMARVVIMDDQLVVNMQGVRKVAALKSEFSVPLRNVKSVALNTEAWDESPKFGQKRMGADLYGFYFGGTFRQEGDKVFYDLKRKEDAIVIELCDIEEDFSRLIIGVDNPEEIVKLIESAL